MIHTQFNIIFQNYVCLCVQNENIGSLAFEQKYGKLLRMDKIITLKIQDKYLRKLDNTQLVS